MFDYAAFGGYLRSEIEIPDLTPASSDQPDWTLRIATSPSPHSATELLGTCEPMPGLTLRLSQLPLGLRYEGDFIGAWDILENGRLIVCRPTKHEAEIFRSVLLGPVLAIVVDQTGALCLHGSAVALNGSGIAFLAPKLHGKSTLALALTLGGGRLVTDDLVAVDLGVPPMLRPGAHGLRLFGDSVQHLSVGDMPGMRTGEVKHTVTELPPHMLQHEAVPLNALYLLEPTEMRSTEAAAIRDSRTGADAVIAIAQRMKMPDYLIGYKAAGARLARIAHLAGSVGVYRLRVTHSWERFAEVVSTICQWHGGSHPAESLHPSVISHWRSQRASVL